MSLEEGIFDPVAEVDDSCEIVATDLVSCEARLTEALGDEDVTKCVDSRGVTLRLLEDWEAVSDTRDLENEANVGTDVATYELISDLELIWDNRELRD